MKDSNLLKKIFLACVLALAVSSTSTTGKNLANGVYHYGYLDPLVHAIGLVTLDRISIPLATMILLQQKASSSDK